MKRIHLLTLLLLITLPLYAIAQTETYTIDPNHSHVIWHVNHFGFSTPSGKWFAEGTIAVDEAKPQDSKLNVKIQVADVYTGIPKLDEHLKGPDFFDTERFPTATFVSDKIDITGKNTAKVHGILTVHGVSKPITLDVKLNKVGMSPITNKKTAGFTATTKLKRSDFGVRAFLPGLGDDVRLDIEAEAIKNNGNAGANNQYNQ